MKKFETPELEITKFSVEDIITTSNLDTDTPGTEDNMGSWS